MCKINIYISYILYYEQRDLYNEQYSLTEYIFNALKFVINVSHNLEKKLLWITNKIRLNTYSFFPHLLTANKQRQFLLA